MGDPRGFLKIKRQSSRFRQVSERVRDFKQVSVLRSDEQSREQASRCMDCGTPFCQWGCPLGNYIPEWNDYVFNNSWKEAFTLLDAGNNMPEITGRVCPALCEYACVLDINDEPVTIRENELAIIEYAFRKGLIKPNPPRWRTGRDVAIVGSGPAGLSCAAQLNKAGHTVVVFERDARPGGILRYGIPDFKLEKCLIDRRVKLWKKEGISFKTGVNVGFDYPLLRLLDEFDAVVLAGGSRVPRDLKLAGRDLKNIHFAMDYLIQSNKRAAGEKISANNLIDAKGKRVVVIGGGDTGADCVGTAHRHGALSVVQIEVMPRPPAHRPENCLWPKYPLLLKTSSSHEEGGKRHWAVLTKRFIGEDGRVRRVQCVKVKFQDAAGKEQPAMKEISGSEFDIKADLVLLAVGFLHPEHFGIVADLKLKLDAGGNVKTDEKYMTSVKKVFSAGDMRQGQSLVVRAIAEGRRCAYAIDKYLMGKTVLPLL